jgi:hypothetical protein
VEDLALTRYASLVDRAKEVYVHLDGRCPDANEREHSEAHGVVYEGGVDATVQGASAIEVVVLDVDEYDRASRLDPLDLRPYVPGEGDLLVKVTC